MMAKRLQKLFALVPVCLCLLGSGSAWAQTEITSLPYSENFDNADSNYPAGWLGMRVAGSGTAGEGLSPAANDGSASSGGMYLLGASGAPERALGTLASGSTVPAFGAAFVNSTGAVINTVTIAAVMEQWRSGSSATVNEKVVFEYSLNASALNDGNATWTAVSALDLNEILVSSTKAEAVNGNENTVNISAELSGLNWAVEDVLWVRWTDTNDSGSDGIYAVDNFTMSSGAADPNAPAITLASSVLDLGSVLVNSTATGSYTLSGANLTGAVNLVAAEGIEISKSETGDYSSQLTFSAADLATVKTVYVRAAPTVTGTLTGTITHSSDGAPDAVLNVTADVYTPYAQSFNTCNTTLPGGWAQYSVTGAQVWGCTTFGLENAEGATTNAVQINGYSSGEQQNEDWLISPALDLREFTLPIASVYTRTAFRGPGLKMMVSTDYDGTSAPSTATWAELNAQFPEINSDTWAKTEANLAAYKAANVYVAFVYTSVAEANGAARWTVDEFAVTDQQNYLNTSNLTLKFDETAVGSTSGAKQFTFQAVGLSESLNITAPAGFELSKDDEAYSPSLTYTATEAATSQIVYVHFKPTTAKLVNEGGITFTSGSGLNEVRGQLSGSSLLVANTLEVSSWNMEWFAADKDNDGSELGPEDDDLQYENAKKVLSQVNADIFALQEVSNDEKLRQLAQELGYSYISSSAYSFSWNENSTFTPQKLYFLYKPSVASVKKEKVLLQKLYTDARNGSALADYPGSASTFWASGRLPFLVEFEVNINGVKQTLDIVNVHARANSGSDVDKYNMRKYDVQVLKDSLDAQYGNKNVILLGDFNDDVDVSVINNLPSSYVSFVGDQEGYNTLTYNLSVEGANSYRNSSFLDHMIISNELEEEYVAGSIALRRDNTATIDNFNTTTSDHQPVFARFDFSATPVVSFGAATVTAAEGAGTVNINLTLSQAQASAQTVTVVVADGGTATADDYTIAGASATGAVTVTIPANETSAALQLTITDDAEAEGTENVSFTISSTSANIGVGAQSSVTLSIADNDNTTGIADATEGQFRLYPNPTQRAVKLILPEQVGILKNISLSVWTVEGRAVFNASSSLVGVQEQLNNKVAALADGVYIVKVEAGGKVYQCRLLKY